MYICFSILFVANNFFIFNYVLLHVLQPGTHSRELNPFYKNGGTGLPDQQSQSSTSGPSFDVQWLLKALQRAKEQAQDQGKPLEEIAAQRWGSLEKFYELLDEAKNNDKKSEDKSKLTSFNNPGKKEESLNRNRRYSPETRNTKRGSYSPDSSKDKKRRRYSSSSSCSSDSSYSSYSSDDSKSRNRSRDHRRKNKSRSRSRSKSRDHRRKHRSTSRSKDYKRRHQSRSRSRSKSRDYRRKYRSNSRSRSRSKSRDHRRIYKNKSQSPSRKNRKQDELKERKSFTMLKPGDENYDNPRTSYDKKSYSNRAVWDKVDDNTNFRKSGWKKKVEKPIEKMEVDRKKLDKKESSSSSEHSEEELVKQEPIKEKKEEIIEEESTKLLTDKEMNYLAAKLVKAELLGKDSQIKKLKKKLEAARSARDNQGVILNDPDNKVDKVAEEVVILTKTDSKGFTCPVRIDEDLNDRTKKKKKMKTHGQDGKRKQYFPDDDRYDLKKMFEKEKTTSAEDQNTMFEKAAMNNTQRLDDDFDVDDMFLSKAALKEDSAKQQERDRQKAIKQHQQSQRSLDSCKWCFGNKEMQKHLIVSLGSKAYVSLPSHESLTTGHCIIAPISHITCATQADEDVWNEIETFKKSLVKMFLSQEKDCIFFETVTRLRHYPHMVINCVPLPKEVGDMAPIYFKKAIMECETEWSQNKKLVDLKDKGVRRAIPKGLPYFFVDFGMCPGYAHVIEDEDYFPQNFAQEIIGGVLDLEQNLWRKPRKENFDIQRKKVIQFSNCYKDFDPNI